MSIDFGKIATNALSALVATVFVGAAAIVWNAATTIDHRIESANAKLVATQDTVVREIADLKARIKGVESQTNSVTKVLADYDKTKNVVSFDKDKPFVLQEFKHQLPPPDFKNSEVERLNQEIDVRQQRLK